LVDGNTDNGNKLMLWDCHDGDTQRWAHIGDQIVYKKDPSKCVDLNGAEDKDGYALQIWDCHKPDSVGNEQRWHYDSNDNTIRFKATDSTKCIDLMDNNIDNGARVAIWECNGNPQQKWAMGEHLPWLQNNDDGFIVAIVLLSIMLVISIGVNVWQRCRAKKAAKDPALNDPSADPQVIGNVA